jgi:hypothetical protein
MREVTKKTVPIAATPTPQYRPKQATEERKVTDSTLAITRQDSLGTMPIDHEEEKRFKLRLDEDDGTPKFGDKEKHL